MPDKLQEYLDSVRDVPYVWASHDCAMFSAKWKRFELGIDRFVSAILAHGCDSALKFRRLTQRRSLLLLTEDVLGPSVTGTPERGDVVLLQYQGVSALGIAAPPVVLYAGPNGTEACALSFVTHFWRVTE